LQSIAYFCSTVSLLFRWRTIESEPNQNTMCFCTSQYAQTTVVAEGRCIGQLYSYFHWIDVNSEHELYRICSLTASTRQTTEFILWLCWQDKIWVVAFSLNQQTPIHHCWKILRNPHSPYTSVYGWLPFLSINKHQFTIAEKSCGTHTRPTPVFISMVTSYMKKINN